MVDEKVRFGPFELDTKAGELMSGDRRLRLQDKPLKLLVALVERPGQIVTRDELRARLWPPPTVVEFDDGLNTAVNKLRHALGDSAGTPRFIETVGRRGYRFIGLLADDTAPAAAAAPAGAASSAPAQADHAAPQRRWRASSSAIAMVGFGVALLASALLLRPFVERGPAPVTRFTVAIPSAQTIEAGAYQSVAISPNATHLAYVANGQVYLRARDAAAAQPVAGTEEQGPVLGVLFSPDGEWIGFYSARYRELRKVPLGGGTAIRVGAAEGYLGGSWQADGRIVFAQAEGVYAVVDTGGVPTLLAAVDSARGERAQNPALLPNGRGVLFTLVTTQRDRARQIVVQALDPAGRRVAVGNGTDARYVDTGHLVFGDGGTLLAVPFDLDSLQTSGTPFAVAEGLLRQAVIQSVDFAVSANGALVYRTIAQPRRALVWVSRDGDQEPVRAPARAYDYARVSPDGTKIAVSLIDEGREIFVWDLTDRTFTRLTFNRDVDMLPVWMPDSRRIVFGSSSGGRRNISRQSVDGTGTPEVLLDRGTDIVLQPNSIAPDGTRLIFRHGAFVGAAGAQDNNLWSLPLEGGGEAMPLLAAEHHELNGEISPDGRWLAYQSNETGPFEIYIRPFPDVDSGHWQVSTGGGIQPSWSPDGSELFYASGGRLMSVPIRGGATPSIGAARALIDALPYAPYERSGRAYDVAPDGQRFLFVSTAAAISDHPFEGSDRYEVVLNWTEELKRALPAGAP